MGATAAPLLIVASAASAGASVIGGYAQKQQLNAQARMAERQARDVDLQALQTSTGRKEQLRSAMATIEARRVASGLSLDSPSAQAIEAEIRRQTYRDISIDNASSANQRHSLLTSAAANRGAARMAVVQGYLGAAGSLASFGGGFGGGGGKSIGQGGIGGGMNTRAG